MLKDDVVLLERFIHDNNLSRLFLGLFSYRNERFHRFSVFLNCRLYYFGLRRRRKFFGNADKLYRFLFYSVYFFIQYRNAVRLYVYSPASRCR